MQFLTLCHKSIFQYKLIRKIEDYSNLQNYYGSLLSVADMNKQGRLKIKDHQIHKYIKMTDESNIKFAIEGFTNLYGHTINIKSSWVDDFMIKCIQYKEHDYVLKFYEYHNTLRYFPHFDVTENLIKSLDNTQILKLIQTLKKRDLIKVSEQNIDQLLLNDDPQVLYQVFRLSIKRNIKLKGEQLLKIARNLLSANISGKFDAEQFQESGDVYSLLALSYVQAYLKKYQQSIVTLAKILQTDKTIIQERDNLLIDSLKEGVKEDEVWNQRLQEQLSLLQ
ncbi:hypothetical protein pb186bvf_013582 [Paramecium bursaria]